MVHNVLPLHIDSKHTSNQHKSLSDTDKRFKELGIQPDAKKQQVLPWEA